MKRLPLLTIIVVVSLLILCGCENENNETKGPKIETLSAEKGQLFVVSLMGRVSGLEGVALDFECGIEYSTDTSFPDDKTIRQKVDKKYSEDSFVINITHVSPDQQYYYRAYYISQSMIYYGVVKGFNFKWDDPEVATLSASLSDINGTEVFICKGIVNGLSDILKQYTSSDFWVGIQYSTSENFDPVLTNTVYVKNYNSSFGDTISCNISDFDFNKKYYYRTIFLFWHGPLRYEVYNGNFGNNESCDVWYGEVKEFIYSWDVPQVTTLSAEYSEINGVASIKCKGLINGLADIVKNYSNSTLRYGILYSTSEFDVKTIYAYDYNIQMGDTIECVIHNLQLNLEYKYRAFFDFSDKGIYEVGEIKSYILTPKQNGTENSHNYIELGLSVKWATSNVGATNPWDYGGHYAWGETETKNNYSASTYKWCDTSVFPAHNTKYNTDSSSGIVDNKTTLDPEDDVAHVKWGGSWRMPTAAEQDELRNNCTWVWYDIGNSEFGGVAGYKIISKKLGYTDRFIFLPSAGYIHENTLYYEGENGYYWSSTLYSSNSGYAQSYAFGSRSHSAYTMSRENGYAVRPVCP